MLQQLLVNDATPYLDLVHPGTVFRSIDKVDSVGRGMQEIRLSFYTFKNLGLSFLPSSTPGAQTFAIKRTRASDLWVFWPAYINVHGACGSVPANAFTASTKFSSVCGV